MKKTLGSLSAHFITSLYEMGRIIFTLTDVKDITTLEGNAATDFTSRLIKRNLITRLKPGKYIIIPQELGDNTDYIGNWYIAAREITKSPDYYISYYSAMDIHNMTTHPLTKVFITTPKQEYRKERIVGNVAFEFIYTDAKAIWGITNHWATKSEQVRVSDLERTITDCLYQPKYCGGLLEIAKGMWIQKDTVDYDKLLEYVLKFSRNIVIKRLGYILESLNLLNEKSLIGLREKINNKYYVLDPLLSTEKTYKNSWKIIANIGPEEIKKNIAT